MSITKYIKQAWNWAANRGSYPVMPDKSYNSGYNTPDLCGSDVWPASVPEPRKQNNESNATLKHNGDGTAYLINDKGDVVGTIEFKASRNTKNDS